MKRPLLLGFALSSAAVFGPSATAQQPPFAQQAGLGFAQGLSEAIRSASQTNMRPSQAAIDQQTALSMSYDNQLKRVATYYEKRKLGRSYREAERGPPPTTAQLARMSQASKPDRLTGQQYDGVRGRIRWPIALQHARFDEDRGELNQLFAAHAAAGGGINTLQYADIQRVAKNMDSELAKTIEQTTSEQFLAARKFLTSLRYEARFEAGS